MAGDGGRQRYEEAGGVPADPWSEAMLAWAPSAVAFLDRELRYLRVNERLAQLNGVPAAGHIGRTIFEVGPDVAGHAAPLFRQVIETGEARLGLEFTGETAAQPGVARSWLEDVYPVCDHTGAVCGVAVRVEDVTARRQAEAEARLAAQTDRERLYTRGLIEASVDGLVTVDGSGIVSDVNSRMCLMAGLSRAGIIGTPFADYFTDPDAARAGVGRTFQEGVVTDYALTLVSRSGDRIPVSVNASVFRDAAGQVGGVFASARDIRDQLRAAAQLSRLTELLTRTQEISKTGGWDFDLVTGRLTWTDEVYRIYGWDRIDEPPDVAAAIAAFDADSRPVAAAALQRLVAAGEAYDLELGLLRRDGRRIWVRTIGRPEFEDGRIVRVGGSIVDVTARKWAEEQLRHERDLYNATLDAAGAVVVVLDAAGRLLRLNRQAELLTGYREAEVLGRDPYDFLIPADERADVAADLAPVASDQLVEHENQWLHRDGGRRLIHWSNSGLFARDGHLTHLIAVGVDVTEQRRLERQLRARAEHAAIFAEFADGLATLGPEPGGVLERMTVQVAAYVGDTCGVFVLGEDNTTLHNLAWHSRNPGAVAFARQLLTVRPYTSETGPAGEVFRTGRSVVLRAADASSLRERLPVEYRPLFDRFGVASAVYVPLRAAGTTLGVIVTYRFAGPDYAQDEIDFLDEFGVRASLAYENARQDADRKRSQELVDALFQKLPDLICIASRDGYFRLLNPAWHHILGWTVEELCARPYLEFVHPDDRSQTRAAHGKLTRRGEPVVSFENRYRCRDGSYRWLQWNSLPLAERGILVANARDVTARKQAEEALARSHRELERRSEELERSNRNLQQFAHIAATVADVRSLKSTLNTIAGVVVEATDAGACAIVLVDGQPPQAHVAGLSGLPDDYPQAYAAAFRRGRRLPALQAYESGQPVLLTDTRACAALDGLADQSWPRLACFPLIAHGVPVGAIEMLHARGAHLDDTNVRFLQTVADQVAVAVNVARLSAQAGEALVVRERQRLARELHDSVSQSLFSMTLLARASSLRLQRPGRDGAGDLQEMLTDLENQSTSALAEMRALLYELRPQTLSGRSLLVALQAQADALQDRLGLTVQIDAANWRPLAVAVEEELFRIALEALANLVRHASATRVQITLTTQDGMSVLSLADDGIGFDVTTPRPGHLGLETMAERAERIGARLDIDSTPGQGTRVRVLVPRPAAKPRGTPS